MAAVSPDIYLYAGKKMDAIKLLIDLFDFINLPSQALPVKSVGDTSSA